MQISQFKQADYLLKRSYKATYKLFDSNVEPLLLKDLLPHADREAARLYEMLSLGHSDPLGNVLLRQEIAKQYGTSIVTAGSEEALFLTLAALLTKEDHVILLSPGYSLSESFAGEVTFTTEIARVLDLIKKNTKLCIIQFPNSANGQTVSEKELKNLIEALREKTIFLLSDETLRLMEVKPETRLPPVSTLYEKGISINSLSKAYGLEGLQIGWIASQDEALLERILQLKLSISPYSATQSEILALIALRSSDKLLRRARTILMSNLGMLELFIKQQAERVTWVEPAAGGAALLTLKTGETGDAFAERLFSSYQTLVLPGSLIGMDAATFRIGFGAANFVDGLTKLEEALTV